jgi:glycosyltransferase involved in cell wall biosynthesis
MIVYAVPSAGIFGSIKVAHQFVDLLQAEGVAACIATPDGKASGWFRSQAPVVARDWALDHLGDGDAIMFSLPHDHAELRRSGLPLFFHCQGTDPLIDPVLRDENVAVLTCWQQAYDYVLAAGGRAPTDVGISIAPAFHHRGELKDPHVATHMPRRGREIAEQLAEACPDLHLVPIDGSDEAEVAQMMRRAGVYLATAEGEWFGLPALEAMAAGCVVFSVPVLGGMEFLEDGINCVVGDVEHLERELATLFAPARAAHWQSLRHAAIATGLRYRREAQAVKVAAFAATLPERMRRPLGQPRV